MSDQPPKPATTPSARLPPHRLAALAAAEARLAGTSNPNIPDPATVLPTRPQAPSWTPTEKGDKEKRFELTRLLDRGIVRDNGYRQAAECVETLLKITSNIIDNDDPKFRTLKASNTGLKNKILLIKGGPEYLIALGFRTNNVDFEKYYVFEPTVRRVHEIKIGREVLTEHLSLLQARTVNTSNVDMAADEAARKVRALRQYEEDRQQVKDRIAREKIAREAREQREKEEAVAEALRLAQEEASGNSRQNDHDNDKEYEDDLQGGQCLGDTISPSEVKPNPADGTTQTGGNDDNRSEPDEITKDGGLDVAISNRSDTDDRATNPTTSDTSQPRKSSKRSGREETRDSTTPSPDNNERSSRRDRRVRPDQYTAVLSGMGVGFAPVSSNSMDAMLGSFANGRDRNSTQRRSQRDAPRFNSFSGEGQTLGGGPTEGSGSGEA